MALDQARVGEVTAQLMDILEQRDYGEDAKITDVMVIVAVEHDSGQQAAVNYNASPGMPKHVGIGLLSVVQNALLES